MGLLKKYNEQAWKLAYYPQNDPVQGLSTIDKSLTTSALEDSFDKTNLDLENPNPAGGPINVPYMTPVGTGVISSPTTQPFTPKRTYKDSLQDPLLIARATDPYK
jgi:hypothetical protein